MNKKPNRRQYRDASWNEQQYRDANLSDRRLMLREQFHTLLFVAEGRNYNDELTSFYMWANSHELLVAVRHPFPPDEGINPRGA